jgi:hypothetical protein
MAQQFFCSWLIELALKSLDTHFDDNLSMQIEHVHLRLPPLIVGWSACLLGLSLF